MQVHSPSADFGQHVDNFAGGNRRADEVAERVAAAIANGPKAEGELVIWVRLKGIRVHGKLHCIAASENESTPRDAQELKNTAKRFSVTSTVVYSTCARGTQGLTNKEIASQLNLSEFTVKNHLYRIMKQVDAGTRYEAVETVRAQLDEV